MQSITELFQANIIEIIFVTIGLGLIWGAVKLNNRSEDEMPSPDLIKLPYEKSDILLTDTEQKFYHELETVIDGQYTIFAKARLSDFISVKGGMSKEDTKIFVNKLNASSINFLLCTPLNTNIVAAIELDDITNNSAEKGERSAFINRVCKEVGFPLLSFKVRSTYGNEIKAQLEETINFKEVTPEEGD